MANSQTVQHVYVMSRSEAAQRLQAAQATMVLLNPSIRPMSWEELRREMSQKLKRQAFSETLEELEEEGRR